MPAQLLPLRRRIRSVKSMKKITKAQELVATSRIAKAQARVAASRPYAEAITDVLTALASNASIDHPPTTDHARTDRPHRPNPRRARVSRHQAARSVDPGSYGAASVKRHG